MSTTADGSSERDISPGCPHPPAKSKKLLDVKVRWRQYRERRQARKSNTEGRGSILPIRIEPRQEQSPFTTPDLTRLGISINGEEDERFWGNPIGIGCSKTFEKRHDDDSVGSSTPTTSESSSPSSDLSFRMMDPFSPEAQVLTRVRSLSVDWSPWKNKARRTPVNC